MIILRINKGRSQFNKYYEKLSNLRRENYDFKKSLILQKRKFFLLADAVDKTMKNVESCNEDLRMSEKGEIYLAKAQLERTVKDLSEEIEHLSETNHKLIQDLRTKTFFDKYQEVLQELNQLKLEQEALIDHLYSTQNMRKSKLLFK